jgi:hypothetical protein
MSAPTGRGDGRLGSAPESATIAAMPPSDRPLAVAQFAHVFSEMEAGLSLCVKKDLRTAALILLYSGIDIAGWIAAAGAKKTVQQTFTGWVETYIRPKETLGCSALDLYGARCGVLHTFTPRSALHEKGKARKVIYAWRPSRVEDLREMIERSRLAADYVAVQGDLLIKDFSLGTKRFLNDLNMLPTARLLELGNRMFIQLSTKDSETMFQWGRSVVSVSDQGVVSVTNRRHS